MNLLEHVTPADLNRALEARPRLRARIRDIARRAELPEDVVQQHLNEAVLRTLEHLGDRYVGEMGQALRRVDTLRDQVHAFYERVLSGQDANPDPAQLSALFAQLHEAVLDISDPQAWARRHTEAHDLVSTMVGEQSRGVSRSAQEVGGEGTATEDLSPVEQSTGHGRLPRSDGGWDGEPGSSGWVSDNPEVYRITHGEPVQYVDGEPVLQPYAVERVLLRTMTGLDSRDFSASRRGLMRQHPGRWRNITHVEAWEGGGVPDLHGNALAEPYTWHHEPDVEWMSLVPTALHANVPHTGGASAASGGATPYRPQHGPVRTVAPGAAGTGSSGGP